MPEQRSPQGHFHRTPSQTNYQYSSNENYSHFQLGLFDFPATPDLILYPVDISEFEGDRYYLRSGDWTLPFELTLTEAYTAIQLLDTKRDSASVWWAIEQAIKIKGGAK